MKRPEISAYRLDDLTGRRFGRWDVVGRSENDAQGKPRWLCRCECGRERLVRSAPLRSGKSLSCGCFAKEETSARSRKHGQTNTREWETWHRMKQRCYDANADRFQFYGGRGIRVCKRWLDSFQNFYADMGPRPGNGYSIERIDVDGNYEPSNCRWATTREQNRNKRTNVLITAFGRTQLASDWAREAGVSQTTIRDRLRRGLPAEKAVSARRLGGRRG